MQINGKTIEYDHYGDGEAMLLIHGLGGTSNFWRPVINAFQSEFRIVAPDLPSAGRSELDTQATIESLADDIVALMDALEIEKVRLVSHSMGTIIAQHIAALVAERIVDLVLLGPLAEPPEPARAALLDRAEVARTKGMSGIAETIADVALAAATKTSKPNVQGFVREMVLRQAPEAYAASCEALAKATRADPLKIANRCLLITGDVDGVAPPANVHKLGGELADAHVEILENCGHWTLTEQPEAVLKFMRAFYS